MDLPLFAHNEFHSRGSRTTASERAYGEVKAKEQEAAVLAYFRERPFPWSPSQVWRSCFCELVPIEP